MIKKKKIWKNRKGREKTIEIEQYDEEEEEMMK